MPSSGLTELGLSCGVTNYLKPLVDEQQFAQLQFDSDTKGHEHRFLWGQTKTTHFSRNRP